MRKIKKLKTINCLIMSNENHSLHYHYNCKDQQLPIIINNIRIDFYHFISTKGDQLVHNVLFRIRFTLACLHINEEIKGNLGHLRAPMRGRHFMKLKGIEATTGSI